MALNTWTDGGEYWTTKSTPAYAGAAITKDVNNSLPKLDGSATHCSFLEKLDTTDKSVIGPCLANKTFADRNASIPPPAYKVGQESVFHTKCAAAIDSLITVTGASGWAAEGQTQSLGDMTSCTNNNYFATNFAKTMDPDDKSSVVTGVTFSNTDRSCVATAHFTVQLADDTHAFSTQQHGSAVPLPAPSNLLTALENYDVIGRVDMASMKSIKLFTSDKVVYCRDASSLTLYDWRTGQPVYASHTAFTPPVFKVCYLPKQTYQVATSNCCDGCVFSSANCKMCYESNNSLGGACMTDACTCTSVDSKLSDGALVYRATDTMFVVPVDADSSVVCEWDKSGENCLLFGGAVKPVTSIQDSLFPDYGEPAPFFDSEDPSYPAGRVYAVPVKYSLLNAAQGTQGTLLQTASCLANLLNSQCIGNISASAPSCSDPLASAGFEYFATMYTTLAAVVPQNPNELQFRMLVDMYVAYVACQYFFLSVFNYTANLSMLGTSRYDLFLSKEDWMFRTLPFTELGGRMGIPPGLFDFMASPHDQGLFTSSARPVFSQCTAVLTGCLGDVTVVLQLVIPSILFPNTTVAGALSDLLLRLYPVSETTGGGGGGGGGEQSSATGGGVSLQPTCYFDALGTISAAAVVAGSPPASTTGSPFVVTGYTVQSYFVATYSATSRAVGVKASINPPAVTDLLLAVLVNVTVCLKLNAPCMTLLFYAAYLQQHPSAPISGLNNGAFADAAMKQAMPVQPLPPLVQRAEACALVTGACALTASGSVIFAGAGANLVNAVFVTPDAPPCACLNGSNLPVDFDAGGGQGRTMNPMSMCFNTNCRLPAFDLANVLDASGAAPSCAPPTAGAAPSCAPPPAVGHLAVSPLPAPLQAPQVCKQYCDQFAAQLRTEHAKMDLRSVDFNALDEQCGLSVASLLYRQPPKPRFLAAVVMIAVAMPVLYAAVAVACAVKASRGARPAFLSSLAANKAFIIIVGCVGALGLLAAVMIGTQLVGVQNCTGRNLSPGLYSSPSSECVATGALWGSIWNFFRGGDSDPVVPQDFCTNEQQSYCQWYGLAGPGSVSCKSSESSACQMQAADGVCAASTSDPFSGRPIRLTTTVQRWSALDAMLSASVALLLVPLAVAIAVVCMSSSRMPTAGRVAAAIGVAFGAALASATPMFVRLGSTKLSTVNTAFIGPCGALVGFPDVLVSVGQLPTTIPSSMQHIVYTRLAGVQNFGAPVYACAVAQEGVDGVPAFLYASAAYGRFVLTDTASGTQPVVDQYVNDSQSLLLCVSPQQDVMQPSLFSSFTSTSTTSPASSISFCARLGTAATCAAAAGDCPCAAAAAS